METFKAKIKYPAKDPKQGKHGPYISVGVVPFGAQDTNENVVNVFGKPEDDFLKGLHWNQDVTVLKDDKGRYKIIKENNSTKPANEKRPAVGLTTMNREEKITIKNELQAYAKLHKTCFELAAESMADSDPPISEETTQKIATTLFIIITRKYQL